MSSKRWFVTARMGSTSHVSLSGGSRSLRNRWGTFVVWLMTVFHFFSGFELASLTGFKQASLQQYFGQQLKHLQKWTFKNYYNPNNVKSISFFYFSDSHSQVYRDVIYVLDTLISDFFSFNPPNWKKVCYCWFMNASEVPGIILNVHSCSAVV